MPTKKTICNSDILYNQSHPKGVKIFSRGGHSHRLYNIVTTASAVGQWSTVKADRKGAVNGQSALRIRSMAGGVKRLVVSVCLSSENFQISRFTGFRTFISGIIN